MKSRPAVVIPVLALAAALAACSGGGSSPTAGPPSPLASATSSAATSAPTAAGGELTVYGAASLKGVLDEIRSAYEAAVPGTTLTISTDSSAALATQIEQGAPADVFLSADQANPEKLVDAGLAEGNPVTFARNALVVVVPADNPAAITTPADLARPGVRIVAAGDTVPITKYATQVVANLAAEPGYPADFIAAYTANVVSREHNVKALLAKVELGEGDAGIVYVTDARSSSRVATVEIPDAANVPATYDGVVGGVSPNAAAGRAFLDWLIGPDGQAILAGFGFLPAGS